MTRANHRDHNDEHKWYYCGFGEAKFIADIIPFVHLVTIPIAKFKRAMRSDGNDDRQESKG